MTRSQPGGVDATIGGVVGGPRQLSGPVDALGEPQG